MTLISKYSYVYPQRSLSREGGALTLTPQLTSSSRSRVTGRGRKLLRVREWRGRRRRGELRAERRKRMRDALWFWSVEPRCKTGIGIMNWEVLGPPSPSQVGESLIQSSYFSSGLRRRRGRTSCLRRKFNWQKKGVFLCEKRCCVVGQNGAKEPV
jgi:hypothetical protein